jgi:hypothetical protein
MNAVKRAKAAVASEFDPEVKPQNPNPNLNPYTLNRKLHTTSLKSYTLHPKP